MDISMVECKTVVSPLLKQWRCHRLALNHWYAASSQDCMNVIFWFIFVLYMGLFLFNHYLFLTWWCYKLVFNGNISNTSIIMNLFSPEEWVTSVQFWSNNTILPNYILRVFCKRCDSLHIMQWSNMSHLKTHMHADWPNVILSVG